MADDLSYVGVRTVFPSRLRDCAEDFARDYYDQFVDIVRNIDLKKIGDLAAIIAAAIKTDRAIFICGNGGSASIANHTLCDIAKCVSSDTGLKPRVHSLSANVELLSAVANDMGYEHVFAYQLSVSARKDDVLITVSSSGNSPNIVSAVKKAKEIGMTSFALTGFNGGESSCIADFNLHVPIHNYGICEDVHMSVIHIVAQYIRMNNLLDNVDYTELKF